MTYGFNEQLEISKGKILESDLRTIESMLLGCVEVKPASKRLDLMGVDYIATLRKGTEVFIDAKTRRKGSSKYWKNEPELAIEIWSVMPKGKFQTNSEKAGWTVDEAKKTHMILYTFDQSDTQTAFLLPFQSLRMAARNNVGHWLSLYKVDIQESYKGELKWESQAVFVPASVVIAAMELTYSSTSKPIISKIEYPLETKRLMDVFQVNGEHKAIINNMTQSQFEGF